MIEVVDEKDEVVDSKSRTEVHKLGLLHRQVYVWMFDEDKNIFFQKRGLHSRSAGLLDTTVGGHVNQGEDYLSSAVREAEEETGISISPSDLMFLRKFRSSHDSNDYFLGTLNNFFGVVYVYKHPINEQDLKKEEGIPGGGFQKLSYNFLLNPEKEYIQMIHPVVFSEQIPYLLKYLQ